jgi:oligosaccharide reducing-end xylanase
VRTKLLQTFAVTVGLGLVGCSAGQSSAPPPSDGGDQGVAGNTTTTGGSNTAGAGVGGGQSSGGNANAGSANGGNANGGNATGGTATGGNANAGSATGGTANGGNANGGSATGGTANGGTSAGGISAGGTSNGGSATGGIANGGTSAGGTSSGGTSAGGTSAGGTSAGGTSAGGSSMGGGGSISSTATTTIPGNGCTPPGAYANLFISLLAQTQATSDAKLTAAWGQLFNPSNANTIFYSGPGTGEAYVEDVNNQDVRSEGMSYGMMIALQLNHQTEFDELWTFVKNHMWKTANTISWQVNTNGSIKGSGGAPDGDEWFAAALVFASKRWGNTSGKYNYASEAQKTLDLVRTTDFSSSQHLVRYFSGTDSNGTDASYMLPAFYQTWACFDTANATFWNQVLTTTRAWLQTAAGTTGNIGDQSSFAGATTNSSGDDKLRIVANFMSDYNFFNADPFEATYASEYATWVNANNNGSTAMLACNGLLGFGLPASTGKPFVQKLWSVAIPTGKFRYYDGALYTIALLHVSGGFRLWY